MYRLFIFLARGPPPHQNSPRQQHREPAQPNQIQNQYQNNSNQMQNTQHSGSGYPQNQHQGHIPHASYPHPQHSGFPQTTNQHQQQIPHSGYQQPQRSARQISHAGYQPDQQGGPYSSHPHHHQQHPHSNMQEGHRGKNIVARIRNDAMSESSSEDENDYMMRSGQSDGYHRVNTGRIAVFNIFVFYNFSLKV